MFVGLTAIYVPFVYLRTFVAFSKTDKNIVNKSAINVKQDDPNQS